ncbi:MAG: M23 family metallopeptidase [Desulfobacteraceae bacterium]|jgi:murein DD-endopeptidase MepM/ murein hydrolase activator NlpD
MAKKYAFILLGGTGKTIKQYQISKIKLIGFGLCLILGLGAIGYGVTDYIDLRHKVHGKASLERELAMQTEEVIHQREQIQKFALEINSFKQKLVQLDQYKQSVRIFADIDNDGNDKGLFGVGGSAPEDLNPSIELTQRHQGLIKDMHRKMGQLNNASANQKEDFELLLGELESQRNMLAHTPAIRPVDGGWISSNFGYRRSPFTGKREFHKGLDIANHKGSPIVATANGVVTFTGRKWLLGNVVVIDHGHGIVTRYAHLDKVICEKGAKVQRGAVIGHMGNSGRSTGPHLHYEVRLNGVPMDPAKYILN